MKRLLISVIAFLGLATTAFAQAPSPPMMWGYDWNGPYVGINGGGGWGNTHWQYTSPSGVPFGAGSGFNIGTAGGLVGGTAGYNWQLNPHWLVGGETDMDWADIFGAHACPNPSFSCRSTVNAFGSFRARGGYVWNRLLIYGTAGLALGDIDNRTVNVAGGATPPSGTAVNGTNRAELGWTAGGGVEYAIWGRASLKAEALYYDFGDERYAIDNTASQTTRDRESGLLFRVGLNWNFAPPPAAAPPVAPMPVAAPAAPPMPQARTFLVFFDFDRYNLTPDAGRVVGAAAESYKATGSARVEVSGYTDLAGTQAYNLRLSQRRADAVARALERDGVPRNVMDVKWFGKEHPRVPTPDGVREPQNRRVEIVMP